MIKLTSSDKSLEKYDPQFGPWFGQNIIILKTENKHDA
jgi:hypothetical protein